MVSRAIKISEENYIWLLKLAGDIQKKRNRPVSFDDTLDVLKRNKIEKKDKLMSLAGSWKMSDKEAGEIINGIYRERKIDSRRL
jgi:predicted CopG family antitoxin